MISNYDMALERTMNIEENLNGLKEKKTSQTVPLARGLKY